MSLTELKKELNSLKNKEKAKDYACFFKTGKGEYGEGDVFLGIKVPVQRQIAKKYSTLSLADLENLLSSKIHEYRLTALLILVEKYQKSPEKEQKQIFNLYLKNTKYINNWDLVDLSAPKIVGTYLLTHQNRKILYQLAHSRNLWEKRIAVLATLSFIKEGQFSDSLKISQILLHDNHDLIHKAVGWMLREVGKKDLKKEEEFLNKHYQTMPRTMLRYAIEKFPEAKRKFYLKKSR